MQKSKSSPFRQRGACSNLRISLLTGGLSRDGFVLILRIDPLINSYARASSLAALAGASPNCTLTRLTTCSTDRPYLARSSSWVEACSIN